MITRIQPWTEPQLMDRESVFESLVEKALHKTMRALASEVAGGILTAATTLPLDPTTTGAYATAQGAVMAEWTAQVNASLYPFLTSTFTDSAERVVDGVAEASGIVVDQLTGTYADEVLQTAHNRMVGIGESLWLNIRDQLVEGYNAGESIPEIAERLTQVAGLTVPRANTVARTEIISAANNGSYLQMLDAGFDTAVTKVWLATEDTRTRLSHRHADNQGVDLTGEFSVDIYSGDIKTGTEPMEFPGDPSATPGNTINCRCSLAFDFEDEAEEVLVAAKSFTEKDHPRDNDGKFKKKGAADKYFKIPDVADKPGNEAPMGEKVAWMVTHKWQSMLASQKSVLIQNIDEPTWQKFPPELKEKVLNAPSTTSHPVGKQSLEDALKKIQGFQDEADDDADTDVPGARPVGGVDTKTGKALVPGKPTKLRVQLLYNTTFADGAIMAVRKDSGERVVWDEKTKKINRQKLGADGKYATTESLSRGAAYAAWKDEDGWTIPDAADAAPAASQAATPSASPVAVGKPVKLKVQLIYQTPFEDGDVVAVNPTTGETIHWDAKKKRMVVTSELGTTEYTRGALYKQFKDEDGWHLPVDKKTGITPAPVVAKKFIPPAKSAKPAVKKPAPVPATVAVQQDKSKTPKFTFDDISQMLDVSDSDKWPNGTVLWEDDQTLITKYNQDGDIEVTHVPTGKNEVIKGIKVDTGTVNSAVENVAMPDAVVPAPEPVSTYVASDDANAIYSAWDTGIPGEIWSNGPFSVALAKNGNLLFLDAKPNGGVGIIKSADVNSENIDKALEAVMAGKSWTVNDAIPEVDPDEINAPGGSDGVSAGQDVLYLPSAITTSKLDDISDEWSNTFYDEEVYEDDAVKLTKVSKSYVEVFDKKTGKSTEYKISEITPDHINDFLELNAPDPAAVVTPAPSAPVITKDKVATIKDWAKQSDIPAGEELHNGTDFKIVKASPGAVVVYPKLPDGNADTNKGLVLFGEEITQDGVLSAVNELGSAPSVTPAPVAPAVVDANVNLTVTGKTMTPSVVPGGKPMKLGHSVLVGKTSQGYYNGQVVAEHPGAGERLVWNATTKKYDVQVQSGAGVWETAYSYNKQAALKNLKNDAGWVTPTSQNPDPGSTPGSAPTLSVSGSPVAPSLSAVDLLTTSKPAPKFDPAQLNAASDVKIESISDADAKKVFNEFKTGKSTIYLSTMPAEVLEAVLRAQKKHNDANPGNQLNMLETIALVDKYSAQVAGVANGHLYREKIVTFLNTPSGKSKANEIIAEFRMTPAEKAKIIADKAAAAKAANDIKLKELFAVPVSKPHTGPFDFKVATTTSAQDMQDKMLNGAPWAPAQKSALKKYTGSYYYTVNNAIRGKGTLTDDVRKDAINIQKGMRPLGEDLILYRGVGAIPDVLPNNLADMQALIGTTFVEPAFSSTSINNPFGGQIKLVIEAPKGTPAAYVKSISHYSSENEVLLGANTKFQILEAKQTGYSIEVRVRVVP